MILYAAESLSLSGMGAGVAAQNELTALLSTGYPVTVLTPHKVELEDVKTGSAASLPRWLSSEDIFIPQPPALSIEYVKAQWRLIQLTKSIQRTKPSLLIAQGIQAHRRLEKYKNWQSCKRILILHGVPSHYAGQYKGKTEDVARIHREVRMYDAVVISSERVAKKWEIEADIDISRFAIIPNHCGEKEAQKACSILKTEARRRLGLSEDRFIAVTLATIQKRKGQDIFINALKRMGALLQDIDVYFVGPVSDWGGEQIVDLIRSTGLQDVIHVMGIRKDAYLWLRAADVMVLSSRAECSPLSILMAMAVETPVIVSSVDGNPEMVVQDQTGWLFDVNKPMELTDILIKSMRHREVLKDMGCAALELYYQQFSKSLYQQRWNKLVDRCLCEAE